MLIATGVSEQVFLATLSVGTWTNEHNVPSSPIPAPKSARKLE